MSMTKAEKRAEALRENLLKRKMQVSARKTQQPDNNKPDNIKQDNAHDLNQAKS